MAGTEYRTENRTRMMEYLRANRDRTVSVGDISNYLKKSRCPVNTTTIYRYLDKLEKDGHVIKYTGEAGGKAGYQYVEQSGSCTDHLHLQCTGCGAMFHLNCGFMDEISTHILQEHGFSLQCKGSILYGLCRNCRVSKKD